MNSEFDRIKTELYDLRHKLHHLEKRLEALAASPPDTTLEEKTVVDTPVQPSLTSFESQFKLDYEAPAYPTRGESVGIGKTLGVVAILCFVLAATFLVVLAIDAGWLTPPRQIGLSALFGFTLIALGLGWIKKNVEYFSLLPVAGIIILYLTAYAGKLYAGLYDSWAATFIVSSISVGALVLYRRLKSDFYPLVAVVGVYLCPVFLPKLAESPLDLMTFFLVWNAVVIWFAVVMRARGVILLAAYLALGLFSMTSHLTWSLNADRMLVLQHAFFQLIQFLMFAAGVVLISVHHRISMTSEESLAYFPLLVFFYGIEYSLVYRLSESLAPWLALGFGGFLYGAYHRCKSLLRSQELNSGALVFSFLAIVGFHAGYLEIVPAAWAPWFALLLMGSFLWMSQKIHFGTQHLLLILACAAVIGLEYFRVLFKLGSGFGSGEWIGLSILYFAAFFAAYAARKKTRGLSEGWLAILIFADLQALTALFRLAVLFTHRLGLVAVQGFAVSLSWGLFALAILLVGKKYKDRLLAQSSLFIFGISAAKVLLLDVAMTSAVVRILCLLSLGVVLYIGGYLYQHIDLWASSDDDAKSA